MLFPFAARRLKANQPHLQKGLLPVLSGMAVRNSFQSSQRYNTKPRLFQQKAIKCRMLWHLQQSPSRSCHPLSSCPAAHCDGAQQHPSQPCPQVSGLSKSNRNRRQKDKGMGSVGASRSLQCFPAEACRQCVTAPEATCAFGKSGGPGWALGAVLLSHCPSFGEHGHPCSGRGRKGRR